MISGRMYCTTAAVCILTPPAMSRMKQAAQMEKKVEADSLAYRLTAHQYEEGLSTAIDLRTTSAQLLHSKALLLQCRLMAMVKEQLVRYYQGIAIWTE